MIDPGKGKSAFFNEATLGISTTLEDKPCAQKYLANTK